MNIMFEMSYCFLQEFFQLGILLKLGLQAWDVAGWLLMVGQKVIWGLLTARGLGHWCRTVLHCCGLVKS